MEEEIFDFQAFPKTEQCQRATITHHQEELLYYDGPILFAGKNADGERVLGISIVWDSTRKIDWYLHGICGEKDYWDYRHKTFGLAELFRRSDCFLLGYNNESKLPYCHQMTFTQMPDGYGPEEEAYFPGDDPSESLDADNPSGFV